MILNMIETLILNLFDTKCIQFGSFTLKSGEVSPIYIDLKNIVSFPHIVNNITKCLYKKMEYCEYTKIVGVPYGGLVISTALLKEYSIPMILVRKEVKKYGMKKNIEGELRDTDKLLVIEDTITSGSSVLNFISLIKTINKHVKIEDIIVICDRRCLDNKTKLYDYNVHSLFTMHDIITTLLKHDKLSIDDYKKIKQYLDKKYNNVKTIDTSFNYLEHSISNLIKLKKSNICPLGLFNTFSDLCSFIEKYNSVIIVLFIHINSIIDLNKKSMIILKKLSYKYNFKIADLSCYNTDEKIFLHELTSGIEKYKYIDFIQLNENHSKMIYKIVHEINSKNKGNINIILDNFSDENVLYKIIERYKIQFTKNIDIKDIYCFKTTSQKKLSNNDLLITDLTYFKY